MRSRRRAVRVVQATAPLLQTQSTTPKLWIISESRQDKMALNSCAYLVFSVPMNLTWKTQSNVLQPKHQPSAAGSAAAGSALLQPPDCSPRGRAGLKSKRLHHWAPQKSSLRGTSARQCKVTDGFLLLSHTVRKSRKDPSATANKQRLGSTGLALLSQTPARGWPGSWATSQDFPLPSTKLQLPKN